MTEKIKFLSFVKAVLALYIFSWGAAIVVIRTHGKLDLFSSQVVYSFASALLICALAGIVPIILLILGRFRRNVYYPMIGCWVLLVAILTYVAVSSPI